MTRKYDDTNCQPIGSLATKDLLKLEHKYRLLLKESGFQDIENWDNNPRAKKKKVVFIRGHIRFRGRTPSQYLQKVENTFEFFRIVGLWANHAPNIPDKYRTILQDYSLTGNMAQSIKNTNSKVFENTFAHYVKKNLNEMIEFVRKEFHEREEGTGKPGVN